MSSNSMIRARARAALGGGIFKNEWLYALLVCLVATVITGVLSLTGIGPLLVSGILSVSVSVYFLGRIRGTVPHDSLGACVNGVKDDLGGPLVLGLLHSIFIALWTMLFFIPGIVKSCSYAMAFYIKCDNPGVGANDCITMSRKMMKGYKAKYFGLQLSFIGWMIVGAFCFGVGTLWVSAYMSAANAAFYEELKRVNPVEAPAYTAAGGANFTVSEPQESNNGGFADGNNG